METEPVLQNAYGKGAKGSGLRERVPLWFGGFDRVLRIYLDRLRPKFLGADQPSDLYLSESGERISAESIRRRLREHIAAT